MVSSSSSMKRMTFAATPEIKALLDQAKKELYAIPNDPGADGGGFTGLAARAGGLAARTAAIGGTTIFSSSLLEKAGAERI